MTIPHDARYARHLVLPEVGPAGQDRLKRARVLVIGTGGLGSPVALYLAAAGVGTIGLADPDRVDLSNLQRQIAHDTPGIGRLKVESARDRLLALNPSIHVETHAVRIDASNARSFVTAYDLIVDGTDNFRTRYLVNDACVLEQRPLVHGSIYRFEGQASVFHHAGGPCYRCLFPEPPPQESAPSCSEAGVLGVLPGVIGCIQATEAVKCLLGIGTSLSGRLLLYDALKMTFRTLQVARDPACAVCGDHPTIRSVEASDGPNCSSRETEHAAMDMTPTELKAELTGTRPPVLLDVREPAEWNLGHLPGAKWIPLGELESRIGELDPSADLVCYCKAGGRSARAMAFLVSKGFRRVRNLAGGILAWSDQIDPSLPKY